MSNIQLNDVVFTRNSFMGDLLQKQSNSTAIIQNNKLTECNVLRVTYPFFGMRYIRLHNVVFRRNNLLQLLEMQSSSNAIRVQNFTFT